MSTILQITNADRNLSSFSKGLKASGLESQLAGIGPFTILGPVNLAFGRLNSLSFEELLKPEHNSKLIDLISDHILIGKKMLTDFRNGQKLKTLGNKEVTITINNEDIHINGARILAKDRQGSNGVVHSLDIVYKV
jgi:uncharacterized surface protein with fasciclin (FAS1) repeats